MRNRRTSVAGAIRLVHPFPVATVVVTTGVLLRIAHGGNPGTGFMVRGLAVVLLSQVAVGALNDFTDRHLDRVAQPTKPIPAGLASPGVAIGMVVVSLGLFLPLAATFGPAAFFVSLLGTGGGLAYDLYWKPTVWSWLGYFVGFMSLVTWIWLIAGRLSWSLLPVYPGGALLLLAAHLAQSYPDIETDRRTGQRGAAAIFGPRRTFTIITRCLLCASTGGAALSLLAGSVAGVMGNAVAVAATLVLARAGRSSVVVVDQRPRVFRVTACIIAGIAVSTIGAISGRG